MSLEATRSVDLYGVPIRVVKHVVGDYVYTEADKGKWKPGMFATFRRHLKPGMCFVDIGAFAGATAMFAAAMGCKVLAFEPDPMALEALEQNLALNPDLSARVTLVKAAVAAHAGMRRFGPLGRLGSSQAKMLDKSRIRSGEEHAAVVCAVTLEDALTAYRFESIDFLKVNTHGAEGEILASVAGILARNRPTVYIYVIPRDCDGYFTMADISAALRFYDHVEVQDHAGNAEALGFPGELLDARWLELRDFNVVAWQEGEET